MPTARAVDGPLRSRRGSHDLERRTSMSSVVAALIPIIVMAVGFEVFCLVDVVRAEEVRYLPRWAWAVICLISIPLGGIAYLIVGRSR
jgi:Phospholipase_D-nuclease N-terminal